MARRCLKFVILSVLSRLIPRDIAGSAGGSRGNDRWKRNNDDNDRWRRRPPRECKCVVGLMMMTDGNYRRDDGRREDRRRSSYDRPNTHDDYEDRKRPQGRSDSQERRAMIAQVRRSLIEEVFSVEQGRFTGRRVVEFGSKSSVLIMDPRIVF